MHRSYKRASCECRAEVSRCSLLNVYTVQKKRRRQLLCGSLLRECIQYACWCINLTVYGNDNVNVLRITPASNTKHRVSWVVDVQREWHRRCFCFSLMPLSPPCGSCVPPSSLRSKEAVALEDSAHRPRDSRYSGTLRAESHRLRSGVRSMSAI